MGLTSMFSGSTIVPASSTPRARPRFTRPEDAAFGFGAFPVSVCVAFLAGFLTPFTVSLGGEMPLGELVLLAAAGWAALIFAVSHAWPGRLWRDPVFHLLMACQVVALAAYVVSDLYRGSEAHDMARGWARMIFLAADLAAVAYLFGCSPRNFPALLIGIQLGELLKVFHDGALFGDYWKFGCAIPVAIGVLLLAGRGGRIAAAAAAAALGLANFILDFRSLGMICLLVAALIAVQIFPRTWRALVAPLGLGAGLVIGGAVYAHTRSDREGDRSNRSNVERTAMVVAALEAIQESPLLGHGSWFSRTKVIDNFMVLRDEGARLAGVGGFAGANDEEEPVALHSQLLVTLAEGGLFGASFFIPYILCLVWAACHLVVIRDWNQSMPLRLFVICLALFHAFMSPFSGAHRVHIALAAALVIVIHRERAALASVHSAPEAVT